jgi:hypothetical protein
MGTYKAMLWLTILISLTSPFLLIFYVPLLLFLGLGLKPFLISTGLAEKYQAFSAERMEGKNERLKQAYYKRNSDKLQKRDKHLEEMRKKMMPKG